MGNIKCSTTLHLDQINICEALDAGRKAYPGSAGWLQGQTQLRRVWRSQTGACCWCLLAQQRRLQKHCFQN